MVKTNFKTTIRSENNKLQNNKFKMDEKEIDQIVDKQIPCERHFKLIYYYIYENNWIQAQSLYILIYL